MILLLLLGSHNLTYDLVQYSEMLSIIVNFVNLNMIMTVPGYQQ